MSGGVSTCHLLRARVYKVSPSANILSPVLSHSIQLYPTLSQMRDNSVTRFSALHPVVSTPTEINLMDPTVYTLVYLPSSELSNPADMHHRVYTQLISYTKDMHTIRGLPDGAGVVWHKGRVCEAIIIEQGRIRVTAL